MANEDKDPVLSHSGGSESDTEGETCSGTFESVKDYADHLQGHKHSKKGSAAKLRFKCSIARGEGTESKSGDESDESSEMYCDVCNKYMTGYISYSRHIKGNVHAKKFKKQKLSEQLRDVAEELDNVCIENCSVSDDEGLPKPFAQCSTCQKEFSGPEPLRLHLKSATHMKKVKLSKALLDLKSKCEVEPEDDDPFSRCQVCQKTFSGFLPYQIHMQSGAHKKSLQKKKVAEEIEQFCSTADPELGYACKECERTFRDPLAFKSHLLNNSHEKWKARTALIDFLSSYPEIVYSTPLGTDGSDDTDSKYFLICKLCNVAFSGPENARKHVKSQKHIIRKLNRRVAKFVEMQEKSDS